VDGRTGDVTPSLDYIPSTHMAYTTGIYKYLSCRNRHHVAVHKSGCILFNRWDTI